MPYDLDMPKIKLCKNCERKWRARNAEYSRAYRQRQKLEKMTVMSIMTARSNEKWGPETKDILSKVGNKLLKKRK
jgi:hypothetical protein